MLAGALALCITGMGPAGALTAAEVSATERAEVTLVSDHAVAAPGSVVKLALHQKLVGDWHTYWINPGDSGLAPTIEWTLPQGVTAGEIQWPAPKRMPIPPLMNYGYAKEAVLVSEITVPDDWPAGEPIELIAAADWLICEAICVPEAQTYTLTIPTAAAAEIAPAEAEIIARGLRAQARPAPELPVVIEAAKDGAEAHRLAVLAPEFADPAMRDIYFFPAEWGVVDHAAEQKLERTDKGVILELPIGGPYAGGALDGVLRATDTSTGDGVEIALAVTAVPGEIAAAKALPAAVGDAPGGGLMAGGPGAVVLAAGLAFLGGVLLNLMPCVFPVLALKALSVARAGQGSQAADGLAYGAGVLTCFLAVGGVLVALKGAGASVGWGFQLQEPLVVGALAYLMFAVGLNLSGVFEVTGRLAGLGASLADRGGRAGSFFTGVLAVLVASPCTAPFMGAAMGFALTQSAGVTLAIFAALATGFALPLMALSMVPALARAMPKPGVWMERLRQALAFPMYLTAAWLAWVFGGLAGVDALFGLLVGLVLLALAAWALGSGRPASPTGRLVAGTTALLAVIGAGAAMLPATGGAPSSGAETETARKMAQTGAIAFSDERLAELRREGRPIFVNFTADWCISCKVNERLVLAGDSFRSALAATDAAYMVGDWTRRDDAILKVLEAHGRAGVPLYLVYPADAGEPAVLPQILTPGIVADALAAAARPAFSTAAATSTRKD